MISQWTPPTAVGLGCVAVGALVFAPAANMAWPAVACALGGYATLGVISPVSIFKTPALLGGSALGLQLAAGAVAEATGFSVAVFVLTLFRHVILYTLADLLGTVFFFTIAVPFVLAVVGVLVYTCIVFWSGDEKKA